MSSAKMTSTERSAVASLASIMSLRMIGLFMVLPVFSLYAMQLSGATAALIGIAMGSYGLSQALFQIPFGALSDRFGRKPIIVMGLSIFILGSLLSGMAHSITLLIIGRTLQGAGAVGSTILAMLADLTPHEQRTKSMAIVGMSIGFSFSVAMLAGPLLAKWLPITNLFFLAALFGLIAIVILYLYVPTPQNIGWHRDTEPELKSFLQLLIDKELAKLNLGIFFLHAIFTASFVVIPISLLHFTNLEVHRQWLMYLPTLLLGFTLTLILIGVAERKQQLKRYFLGSIFTLMLAEILLWRTPGNIFLMSFGLCLFFAGFSILEAFLPSLISRTAPLARKGSALGLYSCAQFLGIFSGGVLGGWLYSQYHFSGVYLFCVTLSLFWFILAFFMQSPPHLVTHRLRLSHAQQQRNESLVNEFKVIPGMIEVTFVAEDGMVYLKTERSTAKHPDFIRLKEQLQSE